jgi:predicted nucleic acid-binding protein
MKLFFDTSALVKYFHEETGSRQVTALIDAKEHERWVSELAHVEFLSALCRRFRNGEISADELHAASLGFDDEIASFKIEPMGHSVIAEAEILLHRFGKGHGLRALDALHLATFNLIAEQDWRYVVADSTLCNVVRLLGFEAINPLE